MTKHYVYYPQGVCSSLITFDVTDGKVHNIVFTGGCRGNTQGVAALADGMEVEEVIRRVKGINCHNGVSCPDQLARALEKTLQEA